MRFKQLVKFQIFCLILSLFSLPLAAEWQTEDAAIMGTKIRVEVWHSDADKRQEGIDSVLNEMERVNHLMSPYIEDSQLSKINQLAHEEPVKVDRDLFHVIEKHSFQIDT